MTAALILYALVGAMVLGWLLHEHLTARHPLADVPLHVLIAMPLLWLPVLLAVALLLAVAIVVNAWRERARR